MEWFRIDKLLIKRRIQIQDKDKEYNFSFIGLCLKCHKNNHLLNIKSSSNKIDVQKQMVGTFEDQLEIMKDIDKHQDLK